MLHGKKVYLCSVDRTSLEQMRNWRNQPELRKYFRMAKEISKDMQEEWYTKSVMSDQYQVNFEIHESEGNALIGHCGLYYIDWIHRHAEFGIYVGDMQYRSGGYGSDALRTLVKYGFNDLNLNKIWCEVYTNNDALAVYEHLGFQYEGTLRQNYYNEGKYWDSTVLSMLKSEFQKIK